MNKELKSSSLWQAEIRAAESKSAGKSRSSLYREIDRDPELRAIKYALKALFKGLRSFRKNTLDGYSKLKIFEGIDPETVKRSARRSVRQAAVVAAGSAHHQQAIERLNVARKLLAKGMKKKDVAKEIGISDRGLRKLLKNKQ